MLDVHGPVRVTGYGRSNVAVGPDGFAVVRNPYDVGDIGERFAVVLIGGSLLAVVANSLWPGHLDTIGLVLGLVLGMMGLLLVGYAAVALVQAVTGTVSAIARPREAIRELKRSWRGLRTHGITDYLADHDPGSIRFVLDAAELREVTPVQRWLRPALEITLRSGQIHRVTAHPWWRWQLTGLAKRLRELDTSA